MGQDIKNTKVITKANEILGRLLNLALHKINPPLLKGWQKSETPEKQHRRRSILLLHNSSTIIWRPPLQWHLMYKSEPVGRGAGGVTGRNNRLQLGLSPFLLHLVLYILSVEKAEWYKSYKNHFTWIKFQSKWQRWRTLWLCIMTHRNITAQETPRGHNFWWGGVTPNL